MKQPIHNFQNNQGIVLFISLIFLFVSTLLGITTLRSNFFNEKMASNTVQRAQALEVAEVALLAGEDAVENYYPVMIDGIITGSGNDRDVTNNSQSCSVVIDGQGGICVAKERSANPETNYDNWVDIVGDSNSLNVWTNSARHRILGDVLKNKYGLNTAPKYIIEFMGYIVDPDGYSACAEENADGSPNSNADPDQLEEWPFCDLDNAQFRVTALATSGNYDETRVMIQSTYVVDN